MKRSIKLLMILTLVLILPILSSCTYIQSLINIANSAKGETYPNTPITVNYYVDDTLYKTETTESRYNFQYPESPTKDGYNFGGWTYKDEYQTLANMDFLYLEDTSIDLYAYFSKGVHFSDNLAYNGPLFSTDGLPSLGSPNVLVVPVDLGGDTTSDMLDDIDIAFNGTSEQTGFESVSSYYKKSSNGRLNLSFDIFDEWFTPTYSPEYYENYDYENDKYYEMGSGVILHEFLNKYDSEIDFSQYDTDSDGYIDAVWMIYNVEPDFDDTTFYWAYVTFSQNKVKYYDDVKARFYGFASYYFIFENSLALKYRRTLEVYDTSDILYDAHTYIHETGHLLGLDDYYDTDDSKGGSGGIYSAGMMDANQGDFNTIDKILLGWADPYVVYPDSKTKTYTIGAFTETNDIILVAKNPIGSIYNEYYLLELYTNTGLNSHDTPIDLSTNIRYRYTTSNYGIRVLHANATTTDEYNGTTYDRQIDFVYNNSTTRNLFLDTLVNKQYGSKAYDKVSNKTIINNLALYSTVGSLVDLKNSGYKNTDQTAVYFDFTIDALSESSATITISF